MDFEDLMRKIAAIPAAAKKRTVRVEEIMAVMPALVRAVELHIEDNKHPEETLRALDAITIIAEHLPWLRWTKRERLSIADPSEPYVGYSSAPYAKASKSSNTSKIAAMRLKADVLNGDMKNLITLSDSIPKGCISTEACVLLGDVTFTFSETVAGSMSRLASKGLACDSGERRPSLKPNHDGTPRSNPSPTTVWMITEKGEDVLAKWLSEREDAGDI